MRCRGSGGGFAGAWSVGVAGVVVGHGIVLTIVHGVRSALGRLLPPVSLIESGAYGTNGLSIQAHSTSAPIAAIAHVLDAF
eukprot:5312316-Alexandrium_andersonii.AAC.1